MMALRKTANPFTRFRRDRKAASLIEFALLFPILAALLGGGFEYSRMIETQRRVGVLAETIATFLAATPAAAAATGPTPATTGTATYVTLHYAHDSAMLILPQVLADSASKGIAWGSDITISMAGISFAPTVSGCVNNCTYVANIAWTGDAKARACATHPTAAASDSSPSSPTTLPPDAFTPQATQTANVFAPPIALIVVDVTYTWRPTVFSKMFGNTTITRSAYMPARYAVNSAGATELEYSALATDDGFGTLCSTSY